MYINILEDVSDNSLTDIIQEDANYYVDSVRFKNDVAITSYVSVVINYGLLYCGLD